MDLQINLIFEEPKESKYKKNSELQLQQEIQNIVKRVNSRLAEEALNREQAAQASAEKQVKENIVSQVLIKKILIKKRKIISVLALILRM